MPGRNGGEIGEKGFSVSNHPQRTSYTKAVQQQELLHHQAMIQHPRFPPPHHYSMTMGSRRGSRSNISSARNMPQQQPHMQRPKPHSFEEGHIDFSNNIPPLPLHCTTSIFCYQDAQIHQKLKGLPCRY